MDLHKIGYSATKVGFLVAFYVEERVPDPLSGISIPITAANEPDDA
jgi:hypothetical protein